MEMTSCLTHLFTRRPLSGLSVLSISLLCGGGLINIVLAMLIGLPDSLPFLISTIVLFLVAGLLATGVRWIPLLGTLLSSVFLAIMFFQPDIDYHMTLPKEGGFFSFVLDLLLFACYLTVFGTTIGATIQNFGQRKQHMPHWLFSVLAGVAGIVVGGILIAAIAQPVLTFIEFKCISPSP